MSIPRAAFTGGPGGGKTTVLEALAKEYGGQILTMPEVASMLLDGGFPKPGEVTDLERWLDSFQRSVLPVQINMENEYMEKAKRGAYRFVAADRGLGDGPAYLDMDIEPFAKRFGLVEQEIYDRYEIVFHLESVAVSNPELYNKIKATNPARYETAEQAAHRDAAIKKAWAKHPNRVIISGGNGMQAVIDQVFAIIDTYLNTEIEVKYLLSGVPNIILPMGVSIRQGYLPLVSEVRVRQMGSQFYFTIKSEGGISRNECERVINRTTFEQLWKETEGRRIHKTRYTLPHGEFKLELDRFPALITKQTLLECEFRILEDKERFELPDWAIAMGAIDVTNNPQYKNRALAINGFPKLVGV